MISDYIVSFPLSAGGTKGIITERIDRRNSNKHFPVELSHMLKNGYSFFDKDTKVTYNTITFMLREKPFFRNTT